MTTPIVLRVGTRLAPLLTSEFSLQSRHLRKEFIQEFEQMPPLLEWIEDEQLSPLSYQIEMESWGYVSYEIDEWTFRSENQREISKKVWFYVQRFFRKWHMDCYDLFIERKLVHQPFVLEYGEEWVDVIESEEFRFLFNHLKTNLQLEHLEPTFWESDYTSKGELVVYVYGHDYFFRQKQLGTPKEIVQSFLSPLLTEQDVHMKNTD